MVTGAAGNHFVVILLGLFYYTNSGRHIITTLRRQIRVYAWYFIFGHLFIADTECGSIRYIYSQIHARCSLERRDEFFLFSILILVSVFRFSFPCVSFPSMMILVFSFLECFAHILVCVRACVRWARVSIEMRWTKMKCKQLNRKV